MAFVSRDVGGFAVGRFFVPAGRFSGGVDRCGSRDRPPGGRQYVVFRGHSTVEGVFPVDLAAVVCRSISASVTVDACGGVCWVGVLTV